MKAIGYIRFSSDEQGNGDSIGRQTANIQIYCQRNALTLTETLIDDGRSASKGDHITKGKLGKFLKQADTGKYRGFALVVEELDRLSDWVSRSLMLLSSGFLPQAWCSTLLKRTGSLNLKMT